MASDRVVLKDLIRKMDRDFLQYNKRFEEFHESLDILEKDYDEIQKMKANAKISKDYKTEIGNNVYKTNILGNSEKLNDRLEKFSKHIDNLKSKLKDTNQFLEKFRTIRTYAVGDQKKIFRFLSGFLDGFSEYFTFKPEFIGLVDLDKIAEAVGAKKENTKVKIAYNKLPKVIEFAYSKGMNNFVIESHNLKMTFNKGYKIKVVAENQMIRKIDKIAKENQIEFV